MLKFKVLNLLNIDNFRVLVSFRWRYNHQTLSGYSLSLVTRKLSACKILGCHDNKRIDTFHGTSRASKLSFHPAQEPSLKVANGNAGQQTFNGPPSQSLTFIFLIRQIRTREIFM